MNIIKRSGMEVAFDASKIEDAVRKANNSVPESDRMTEDQIQEIVAKVSALCAAMKRSPNVEEIQDMVI